MSRAKQVDRARAEDAKLLASKTKAMGCTLHRRVLLAELDDATAKIADLEWQVRTLTRRCERSMDVEALKQMPPGTTIHYAVYYDGWNHQLAVKDTNGVWSDPADEDCEFDFSEFVPDYIVVHSGY